MENNRPSWWPKDWTEWEVGQHLAERSEALRKEAETVKNAEGGK